MVGMGSGSLRAVEIFAVQPQIFWIMKIILASRRVQNVHSHNKFNTVMYV